jgi:hypothetical protein
VIVLKKSFQPKRISRVGFTAKTVNLGLRTQVGFGYGRGRRGL